MVEKMNKICDLKQTFPYKSLNSKDYINLISIFTKDKCLLC